MACSPEADFYSTARQRRNFEKLKPGAALGEVEGFMFADKIIKSFQKAIFRLDVNRNYNEYLGLEKRDQDY